MKLAQEQTRAAEEAAKADQVKLAAEQMLSQK